MSSKADRVVVPIVRPALGEAEAAAAAAVVRSGWLMQGPEVAAFEREFAATVGAPHAVAVANGTAALELALRAVGIGPGDEVITVSHSFIATSNAVLAVGATAVLVDVLPDTLCIDPGAVAAAITPRTRAVLAVHQVGFVADLPALVDLCASARLALIEDAACALGSEVLWPQEGWQRIGRPHGAVACFSFHPRKVLTTGEGGMITCRDGAIAERTRLLRQHGLATAATRAHVDDADGYQGPAFNLRLTDVAAAIGRVQLSRLDAIVAERRALAARYGAALRDHPVLVPPEEREDQHSNWQSFPVFMRPGARLNALEVLAFLAARGVSGRAGLTNAHEEPAWVHDAKGCFRAGPLPVCQQRRRNTLFLPLFHGMSAAETGAVLDALDALART